MSEHLAAEDGFTLPELLIAIALMAVVSAGVVSSTVAVQRNLGAADATMLDLMSTRAAVERVGALLRAGVSRDGTLNSGNSALDTTVAHDRSSITFYSVLGLGPDANPRRVQLVVVGSELQERIWTPTPASSDAGPPAYGGAPASRTILRELIDPDPQTPEVDLFRYWTHEDDGVSATSRCGREIAPTGMAVDAMRRIDSVSFRLRARATSGYANGSADLQGWARFASGQDLGYSSSFQSADCLQVRGFGYDQAYAP